MKKLLQICFIIEISLKADTPYQILEDYVLKGVTSVSYPLVNKISCGLIETYYFEKRQNKGSTLLLQLAQATLKTSKS